MAVDPTSWGILGDVTAEQIENYKNLPAGEFKKLINNLERKRGRRKKNAVLTKHKVFIVENRHQFRVGEIEVLAFDKNSAVNLVADSKYPKLNAKWDATWHDGRTSTSYQSIDPRY